MTVRSRPHRAEGSSSLDVSHLDNVSGKAKRWFAAIMITTGRLPGRGGLFERNAVPLDEVEEFFGRSRVTELMKVV